MDLGKCLGLPVTCYGPVFGHISKHQGQSKKLLRQSQIVQSVMQDYPYVLDHLLPVSNLLVQGPKITHNYCLSRRFYILLWCFTLNFVHFKFINMLN